jgi:hypothetical protein
VHQVDGSPKAAIHVALASLKVKPHHGKGVMRLRSFWTRLLNGDGGIKCPVCGLPVHVQPTAPYPAAGPFIGARPKGELEALCNEQNGTDHEVPIHW